MSTKILADDDFNRLVSYALFSDLIAVDAGYEAAEMLFSANVRAYELRYGHGAAGNETIRFRLSFSEPGRGAFDVTRIAADLDYQCAEDPAWIESAAHGLITKIRAAALPHILNAA